MTTETDFQFTAEQLAQMEDFFTPEEIEAYRQQRRYPFAEE